MGVTEKKFVKLNYKGTLDDGTVFDTSEGREPLEFIFGVGMIIPGLEKGIKGMKKGDKKTVKVKSADAYGEYREEAKNEVPKAQLPADADLKVGMQLGAQTPHGVIPVTISEIKDETVVLDFNPPLAGKDLTFEVEIVEERDATEDELKQFGGIGGCSSDDCSGCGGSCPSSK
jgi:peptidylprolyl isomerase